MERYELIERLSEGGMAEVYLARATGPSGFERTVVVKRLLPDLVDDAEYRDMILAEAKLAGRLCHEHIAQLYDVGVSGKKLFLVMEHVDGASLQDILRETAHRGVRIPVEHTLVVVMAIASALDYAHRTVGAVHRDVSLDNILVTRDGCPKLIDFGVAKSALRNDQTPAGTLKGKLSYMSPEQIAFGRVDNRSDVFSLGVVLWEMTTGRRLFRGKGDLHTMRLVVQEPIRPPSELVADYPRALEPIVMSALDRNPNNRPQSTRALHDMLDDLAHDYDLRLSRYGFARYLRQLVPIPDEATAVETTAVEATAVDATAASPEATRAHARPPTCELDAMLDDAIAGLRLPTAV